MAQILARNYPKYKVKTGCLPLAAAKMGSCCSNDAKTIVAMWGKTLSLDNTKAKTVLGIDFISAEKGIVDLTECLIEY